MATEFKTTNTFNKLTFEEVVDFLEKNGTAAEKSNFKKACYSNSKGEEVSKFNWLNGKRWFCKNFCPELLPIAKPKTPKKSDRIMNW